MDVDCFGGWNLHQAGTSGEIDPFDCLILDLYWMTCIFEGICSCSAFLLICDHFFCWAWDFLNFIWGLIELGLWIHTLYLTIYVSFAYFCHFVCLASVIGGIQYFCFLSTSRSSNRKYPWHALYRNSPPNRRLCYKTALLALTRICSGTPPIGHPPSAS